MPTADEVVVFLTARTRAYQQQMAAATKAAENFQSTIKQVQADAAKPIRMASASGGRGLQAKAKEIAASVTAVGTAAETTTKDVSAMFTAFSRDVPNPVAGLDASLTSVAKSVAGVRTEMNGLRNSASPLPVIATKFTTDVQHAAAATQRLELEINELRAAASRPLPAVSGGTFAPVGRSARKASDQVTNVQQNVGNLSAQFNDIGVTAAAGMSPMLIALQQGTQLSQAFAGQGLRGAVKGIGAAFASVISPVSLLTIAIVAGGAALIQWGISALTAEDGASKLEETLKALEGTMSDLSSVRNELASGNLAEKYGAEAAAAARLLKARRELLEVTASLQISAAFESAGGNIGDLNERIAAIARMNDEVSDLKSSLEEARSSGNVNIGLPLAHEVSAALDRIRDLERGLNEGLKGVQETFGVTADEARRLVEAMGAVRDAEGLEAQSEAAQTLIGLIQRLTGNFTTMNAEGRELVEHLIASVDNAQQFIGLDMASGVASAANAAGRLAENLASGIENARSLIAGLNKDLQRLARENQFFGKPVELAVAETRARFEEENPVLPGMSQQARQARLVQLDEALAKTRAIAEAEQQLAARRREVAQASRGGGGGGASLAPSAEELARTREQQAIYRQIVGETTDYLRRQQQYGNEARQILESLMTPAERLDQKMDEIRNNPILTEEQKAAAVERLKAIQPAAMQLKNTLSSAFKGLFDNLDQGLAGIADTLKDLGAQLLKLALFKQLAKSFPGTFGAGGDIPLVSNATGNVFSGPGISAHSNSVVSKPTVFPFARGIGLMGEAGPEAILPLTRVNGKLGVRAEGSGGRDAPLVQIVDQRGAGAPPIREERTRGPDGREMVRAIVSEDMSRGQFDKPMKGRYGAQPQRVIR